jgi:hypothetical protein
MMLYGPTFVSMTAAGRFERVSSGRDARSIGCSSVPGALDGRADG